MRNDQFGRTNRLRAFALIVAFIFAESTLVRSMDLVWVNTDEIHRLTSEFGYRPYGYRRKNRGQIEIFDNCFHFSPIGRPQSHHHDSASTKIRPAV
jgi:hypothetical protein